tara:strand:+ start:238 stop:546 length:309 start_codon:yes stop_codon:yes gene_type:complete
MIEYQTRIYIIGNVNCKNILFKLNNKTNIDNIGKRTPSQLYLTSNLLFNFRNTAADIIKKERTVAQAEPIIPYLGMSAKLREIFEMAPIALNIGTQLVIFFA